MINCGFSLAAIASNSISRVRALFNSRSTSSFLSRKTVSSATSTSISERIRTRSSASKRNLESLTSD